MPDYRPIIPQSRPWLQAVLGATGASIIWFIAVLALCDHWHDPHQAAVRSDRLDWDRYPRPPYIPALAVQAPDDAAEPRGAVRAEEPAPAPAVVELVKVNPVPPVSERRVVNNGCSPGGERINFQYRGVWHYRCRY